MVKPFILDFSEQRTEAQKPPYFYNERLNLNVIEVDNTITPFVELKSKALELQTKTEVQQEGEDEKNNLLELMTKTFIQNEKDDEDVHYQFLGLLTKTKIDGESDDW